MTGTKEQGLTPQENHSICSAQSSGHNWSGPEPDSSEGPPGSAGVKAHLKFSLDPTRELWFFNNPSPYENPGPQDKLRNEDGRS